MGVNFGNDVPTGEVYEVARSVSRWCDMGMVKQVYQAGLLRDVYLWNFLNSAQLSTLIGGVPLKEWIPQAAGRGKISPFNGGLVFWEVDEADLGQVRTELQKGGAIFNWRKWT
jgi:hypothetical protein